MLLSENVEVANHVDLHKAMVILEGYTFIWDTSKGGYVVGMTKEPSQAIQDRIYSQCGLYFLTDDEGVVFLHEVGQN